MYLLLWTGIENCCGPRERTFLFVPAGPPVNLGLGKGEGNVHCDPGGEIGDIVSPTVEVSWWWTDGALERTLARK